MFVNGGIVLHLAATYRLVLQRIQNAPAEGVNLKQVLEYL
jgi:hypothetical protein